jgi:serine protease
MLFTISLLPLIGSVNASPFRSPPEAPMHTEWSEGRSDNVVVVKLIEGAVGAPVVPGAIVRPLFQRDPNSLIQERRALDPEHNLADLTGYYYVETGVGQGPRVADSLNDEPWVEIAYLAYESQTPPEDILPDTPDFSALQDYRVAAPYGFGFDSVFNIPGADGKNVMVADLEYSWDPEHEDLYNTVDALIWGVDFGYYAYHGDAVLSIMFSPDNGYGVTGLIPEALASVVSPYTTSGFYSVASAISGATELLEEGDVLLIEQQLWAFENYAPVEVDPAVFDAIALATQKGIIVVEPTGNGSQDLDDPKWEGWFDPSIRDSGAIMVGGGFSPHSSGAARSWYTGGSSYGERVDVQGWYDSIVSAFNGDWGSQYADLFYPRNSEYPSGDPRQAYTSSFGGTSGASPIVSSVAAIIQSVNLEFYGEAMTPEQVRSLLIQTGTPQGVGNALDYNIGPQPDVMRALWYGVLR